MTTEQPFCASCGLKLHLSIRPPLVRVGGYVYHAICWMMKEAPGVKAGVWVN